MWWWMKPTLHHLQNDVSSVLGKTRSPALWACVHLVVCVCSSRLAVVVFLLGVLLSLRFLLRKRHISALSFCWIKVQLTLFLLFSCFGENSRQFVCAAQRVVSLSPQRKLSSIKKAKLVWRRLLSRFLLMNNPSTKFYFIHANLWS